MSGTARRVREVLVSRFADWYGIAPEDVTDDRPFAEYGLTSRDSVVLTVLLGRAVGRELPATLLWDTPTPAALIAALIALEEPAPPTAEEAAAAALPPDAPSPDALSAAGTPAAGSPDAALSAAGSPDAALSAADSPDAALSAAGTPAAALPADGSPVTGKPAALPVAALSAAGAPAAAPAARPPVGGTPVAVVGVGCRFPGGADSPAAYWRLLTEGRDAVGTVPEGRREPFVPPGSVLPADLGRHGGFLDRIAECDAEFFGIAADEAAALDPQQRMLLEVTREALDHAAIPAPSLAGTRTGVFVGVSGTEYAHLTASRPEPVTPWAAAGAAQGVTAGRVSYALDLRGPSLAVDTACSSSLVAVDHAVRSLADGTSDVALAAGVNVPLSPGVTLGLQRADALSPTGRCRAFDAAADGMVRGEGCGVVVLKRLADAELAGDRVLAVITATAVSSDGRSHGLTTPNASARRALLNRAHGPDGRTADYVEVHGTGTPLGDPVEAAALGAVLGRGRPADQPLLIGSVKTNIGHLEAAAGIAGLIKTVLALHHDELPGQPHFDSPDPRIDLPALRLRVPTASQPWPRYSGTATAGVSSFGFSGTDAHVVLREYDGHGHADRAAAPPRPAVLLLDAPTDTRLRAHAGELARWLDSPASRAARLTDVGRTLAGRTGRGRRRAAVVSHDRADAATALHRFAAGEPDSHLVTADRAPLPPEDPGPVWVFSGHGSQWPGMAHELLRAEPVFAAVVARLEPVLREHAGISLREATEPGADLSSPTTVMPALFGIQVALAELWRGYGVEPSAVIGHSLGEIAAAVAADALDVRTGARIVASRSRLLTTVRGGTTAVVDLSPKDVRRLAEDLPTPRVAVYASPEQCVVTGSAADLATLVDRVTAEGAFARTTPVPVAGHPPDVDPLLDALAWEIGAVRHRDPACRRYSTVLDDPRADEPYDTAYWTANLRRPVRFEQAVRAAAEDGHRLFVEVAPHPTQAHPLAATLEAAGASDALVVPTLRRGTDDTVAFRTSLATLLVHGVQIASARETLHPEGRITDVPSPRRRRRRHWAGEGPEPEPLPE